MPDRSDRSTLNPAFAKADPAVAERIPARAKVLLPAPKVASMVFPGMGAYRDRQQNRMYQSAARVGVSTGE